MKINAYTIKYAGRKHHRHWWMDFEGNLHTTPDDILVSRQFLERSSNVIFIWYVRCELDWYRMIKEYKRIRSELIPPLVA